MVIAANLQSGGGGSGCPSEVCDEHEKILAQPQSTEYGQMHDHEDTTCGFWVCRGPFVQRFANRRAYVVLFGILGCLTSASYSYFNGTISTVEKRFGIPSKVVGIITVGNDISSLVVSTILTYYASKKHQPRWIGFGMYTFVLFCLMSALPHFIFGPGNDALSLTREQQDQLDPKKWNESTFGEKRMLCSDSAKDCETTSGNIVTPILLFAAQFISGLGGTLYHTLGVSYMDDNISRSQTPLMLSFTYFIRSLGPVFGYLISSICLKMYIAPGMTPIIDNKNPRWLGAWWLGWIILAVLIFVFSTLITLFPKVLPKTELRKSTIASSQGEEQTPPNANLPASFEDMMQTFKRLFTNKILMCNNLAAIFYVLGAMPFFIFMPKYIEIMYAQSASFASLITGTVGLAFSSFGILLSGFILSKYKPRARLLAGWNVMIGFVLVGAVLSFTLLQCPNLIGEKSFHSNKEKVSSSVSCASNCHCDYVKYAPVCSIDGKTNFISPCHAGCTEKENDKTYSRCSCLGNTTFGTDDASNMKVKAGPCPADCRTTFILFLSVICFLQLVGSTGKTTNFLVAVRCVEDKDKPVSMGLGITLMSLAAFIPSPILFGYIIDRSCLVWGKTCTGKSNCWLYNSEKLMYTMNYTSAAFISVGVLFDIGVWYLAKNIRIFEEETDQKNGKNQKTIRELTEVNETKR